MKMKQIVAWVDAEMQERISKEFVNSEIIIH